MTHVLILAATSAIAADVARRYAKPGNRLYLVARNTDKLASVAHRCSVAMVTTLTTKAIPTQWSTDTPVDAPLLRRHPRCPRPHGPRGPRPRGDTARHPAH